MKSIYDAYRQILADDTSEGYSIVPLTNKEHAKQAIALGVNEFAPHVGGNRGLADAILSSHDPELSRAVIHKNTVVGAYFLKRESAPYPSAEYQDNFSADIKGKRGIEGLGLVIHPDHRGHGVGSQLKDYTKTLDADYVWGHQLKTLNNIHHWLKRRKMLREEPYSYVTYQRIEK